MSRATPKPRSLQPHAWAITRVLRHFVVRPITRLKLRAEFVDPRLVTDAKVHGRKVYVYTVNDPQEMRALRALGVDGVFTDYPDRALRL